MPRSYPGNAPALMADKDPTQEMQFDIGEVVKQLGGAMLGIVGDVFDSAIAFGQNIIDTLLGIATHPIESLENWVKGIPILSDIVGLIKKAASSVIPVSHIVDVVKNLLDNGNFKDAVSIAPGFGWVWDGATGMNGGGSAKVTADGDVKELLSNLIDAQGGQKFDLSAYVKWAGVAATAGTHIFIEAVAYLRGAEVSSTPVGSIANINATTANWQPLNGPTWTVPDGADGVRIRLKVSDLVTAGSIWFTNANAAKTGLMPMNFVGGLLSKFQGILNAIPNILGFGGGDKTLDDWADALATLLPIGSFNDWLTKLTSAGNGGAGGSTGIPIWDNAIGMLGNLFGKADKAQTGVQQVRESTLITTQIAGGQVRRIPVAQTFDADVTIAVPQPTAGYRITRVILQEIGPGRGGGRGRTGSVAEAAEGGTHGGIISREFTPDELPPGTVLRYRLGRGGPGQTGTGYGNYGGDTFVKLHSSGVDLIRPVPGRARALKLTDDLVHGGAPGRGGDGGGIYLSSVSVSSSFSNFSHSHSVNGSSTSSESISGSVSNTVTNNVFYQDGNEGESSPAGVGGAAGRCPTGWFGSGAQNPGNGIDAILTDGLRQWGGTGAGGGYAKQGGIFNSQCPGADGGYPGAGGGAAGGYTGGGTTAGGGKGGDARFDMFIYEQLI